MAQGDEHGPVEPHPIITEFYARRAHHKAFVRGLFNDTAPYYDGINRLFSLGSGAWYRRRCLLRAGLVPGRRVIDVAVGTGLLAREAVAITGDPRDVIGLDLSEAMLSVARRKLDIPLIQGVAEALPLAEGIADFVTMGYALRHVSDLVATFREFRRVLSPGGTVLLLEIARPRKRLSHIAASTYLGRVVPFLCGLANGGVHSRTLMRYHWETIENCVAPEVIMEAMRISGFQEPRCETDLDFFCSYIGRKS